jgi:hypothetical protein
VVAYEDIACNKFNNFTFTELGNMGKFLCKKNCNWESETKKMAQGVEEGCTEILYCDR